jgi:hypothetical protein
MTTLEVVAQRLGGTIEEWEEDPPGVVNVDFGDEDLSYPAPADLKQEDVFAFQAALSDLLAQEYRKKWLPPQ